MSSIKYFGYAICAAALAFAACTEPTSPTTEEDDKKLVLSADRTEITSDGTDKVTFTVKYAGEDVTAAAEITNVTDGTTVTDHAFTTDKEGTYEFSASYNGVESNKVTVKAEPLSSLVLAVDKESIRNDGEDVATFTVTYSGQDVTAQTIIVNLTNGERWSTGVNTFTSTTSGDYEFKASYNDMTSNAVKVTVTIEASNPLVLTATKPRIVPDGTDATSFKVMYEGEDVTAQAKIKNLETGEYLESNSFSYNGTAKVVQFEAEYEGATSAPINVGFGDFYKNVLLYRFTGTWCPPCTAFAPVLNTAVESYPDRLVQVTIHKSDEYTPADYHDFASYFAESAVPAIYFDYDADGPGSKAGSMSSNDIVNTIKEYQADGAKAGIAISSTVDAGRNAKVTVRVTPSEAGSYLLGVMLLEDGIVGAQSGTLDYVHDNTLRTLATPFGGEELGAMTENTEVVREFTLSLDGYTDNCHIVAFVNTGTANDYVTTNAAACPVNGTTDYRFETGE